MDLIYADENKKDIGVIKYFDMDLAFGSSENNFELTLNLDQHCCEVGYYVYIDNTEYGGIIDGITVDTNKQSVTYSGRTWHGILDGKVLNPSNMTRNDNVGRIVSGEANELIASIITEKGLESDFEVSDEDSGISILDYQIERYDTVYKAILKMMQSSHAKLRLAWNHVTSKVRLWAELSVDHTTLDNWDSTQFNFTIGDNKHFVNHLVCVGTDDYSEEGKLIARPVIHLFCDANGKVQPYATQSPTKDSHYILDESQKVLSGKDEITKVFNVSSSVTENYEIVGSAEYGQNKEQFYVQDVNEDGDLSYKEVELHEQEAYRLLESKPYDWDHNFQEYYVENQGVAGEYNSIEQERYVYTRLTSKPSDWETNYSNYFRGTYVPNYGMEYVPFGPNSGIASLYSELTKKPKDWTKNYGKYYEYNGVEYVSVSGISKEKYVVTDSKPSNWSTNWKNYYYKTAIWKDKKVKGKTQYYKDKDGWLEANMYFDRKTHEKKKYKKVQKWMPNTYFLKTSYSIAPKFRAYGYWKQNPSESAPAFHAGVSYKRTKSTSVPTWEANTYYEKVTEYFMPAWQENQYFKKVVDHYATIVEEGLKHFNELIEQSKTISIDFDGTEFYDIMDIVGASEQMTGIEVKQNIIKKIVNLTERTENIAYEIGTEV